ncbi:MAG: hypothetical protein QNJ29_10835 [Rhizobiaceae bacterium]|nr:hypothetical protein [Rhizobiaceae bacterium]
MYFGSPGKIASIALMLPLCIATNAFAAGDIEIQIPGDLKDAAGNILKPKIVDATDGSIIDDDPDREGFQYRVLVDDGNLSRAIRIELSGPLLEPESIGQFSIADPFYERGKIILRLSPIETEISGSEVARNLYAINVSTLPDSELPSYFQRARLDSLKRIENLKDVWTNLHSYDVQSVYSYLLAVIEMSKRMYVLPPADIDKARVWMQLAVKRKKERVNKAVGLTNAQHALELLDSQEALRYTSIWQNLLEKSCERRLPLLQAYKASFTNLPKRRKEIVSSKTKIDLAIVNGAIAECIRENRVAAIEENRSDDLVVLEADAKKIVSDIDQQITSENLNNRVVRRLQADQKFLRQIFQF